MSKVVTPGGIADSMAATPSTDPSSDTPFPPNVVIRFAYGLAVEVTLSFAAYVCDEDGQLISRHTITPEQRTVIFDIMERFCREHSTDLGLKGPFWRGPDSNSVSLSDNQSINMTRMAELLTVTFAKYGITLINQTTHPRVPVS